MPIDPIPPAAEAYDYPLLVKHLLHTPLAVAAEREICYAGRLRYDYRTLGERIGRLASALAALGIGRGDTVAMMDWDSHRYLEAFFAVPMMGAVLHTINVRLSPAQIAYTIEHAEDDLLLVHGDFAELLAEVGERLARPLPVIALDDGEGVPAGLGAAGEYEALLAAADPGYAFPELDERTRATTFYTTGTTGNPKGVYYSHRQLVLHTLAAMAGLGTGAGQGTFHKGDVYMPLTPMFHVHAWGLPYVATVMGVKQVYPGRYQPERLLALIEREGVTFSHCVPTILHMLLSSPAAAAVDLSGWKVVIGGAALPPGLARAALERGIDVFGGYGLSETCPILVKAQLEEAMRDGSERELELRCKAGRPLPLVELRVVDEHGRERPRDGRSEGEVLVRAPWLTQGYLKDPEGSAALWRGGWLHTGDLGHIDAQGYLKVSDRLKDLIKSGGEWISSLALEDCASRDPAVAEVAAIGVPDERWGERPVLLVVPRPGAEFDPEAIRARVRAEVERGALPRWAVPERVEVVAALDKTSVGKIDKKRLRARYR